MSNEINLLPKQNVANTKKISPKKKIFEFISYGSLFVIAASSVMLFILASFSPISQLKKEEAALLADLNKLRPEIGKHFIIQERSIAIQDIINRRNTYYVFLKDIIHELPPDVGIDSFLFKDSNLTVDFLTPSLSSIDLYLVKLKFLANEKKYKEMKIVKIFYDGRQGTYILSLNFVRNTKSTKG